MNTVSNSNKLTKSPPSTIMVVLAFAVVYIVWGSTYYFIRVVIEEFPPFLMASIRFLVAAAIMLAWCAWKKEQLFNWSEIKPAIVSGLLMLVIGNGAVVWSEQYLASSLVAILVSAGPIWFVLLDNRNRAASLKSRNIVLGLLIGFVGVIMLFSENLVQAFNGGSSGLQIIATSILIIGPASWAAGSLYSKYNTGRGSNAVNTSWQMLSAGFVFMIISLFAGETTGFDIAGPSINAWLALGYLIIFGSIIGYSSYVWLLSVRPATQVSTHSYVNPIVAVLLGVLLAGETLSVIQITGLAVILLSVLLINLKNYIGNRKPAIREDAQLNVEARQEVIQVND